MPSDTIRISPIRRAWFSADPATSAQNYDEFQSDSEVTEIIRQNPKSILKVDMPHCHPSLADQHLPLSGALSQAKSWLAEMKGEGLFRPLADVLFVYEVEIKSRPAKSQIGLGCMLPTREIWDETSNPRGRIIRNEEIFPEKAQGRAELIEAIDHIIGTVNLAASDQSRRLEGMLRELARRHGEPTIAGPDHRGNVHRVWAIADPAEIAMLQEAVEGEELVVADGNHRSKAAQIAGLDEFLGVVFCAETMNIAPYHRMIGDLGRSGAAFVDELRQSGFAVEPLSPSSPSLAPSPGDIGLYLDGAWQRLVPLDVDRQDPVDSLDAKLIEDRVIRGILGLDPADHRVSYIGGDYDAQFLQAQVDRGCQQCALALPAVTMEQFFRVNAARRRMPRKTTWFSPKIRSGLVIADVG